MIELSGYTGKSADCVRSRMIAANELKSAKHAGTKKRSIKYSTQTLVTNRAFMTVEGGMTKKIDMVTEVNSPEDFENFACELATKKHKNPSLIKRGDKSIIYSALDNEHYYVDILEFCHCA